ncbi:MAG TPA: hypothetical protein VFY29_03150 [Terriglobia bacterium]|nr:hypothetical protein [Terriglobia bacterium]
MKRATQRVVLSLLLASLFGPAVQARRQSAAPSPVPLHAAVGPWDWLENSLITAPVADPLTVADSSIIGLWRLKSVEGSPGPEPVTVVRQYASHPDGMLALAEFTIDDHAIPRFRIYSAKPGVSAAVYTDETFARFLLNGSRTPDSVSFRLMDRNTLSEVVNAGAAAGSRSAIRISADGATLTDVTERLDGAGAPSARETLVFARQTVALDPIRLPAATPRAPAAADAPFNPLLGTWALDGAKSTAKPEAGSVTLHRFIDLGRGAFGTLLVRLSRAGAPSLEMAAVKFGGPDDLVLALPIYTLAQAQIFLERDALPASAVAYKLLDEHTVETIAKTLSNGRISAITTRRFTEDFTEFTETRKAFDAQGKETGETITVYNLLSAN